MGQLKQLHIDCEGGECSVDQGYKCNGYGYAQALSDYTPDYEEMKFEPTFTKRIKKKVPRRKK